MGYGRVLDLVGAFHVEQNVVDVPEQFVMEEFSWERQTIHSYCSSKMPALLCARAPPVIRAALFTSLVCWVHWLPDPVGCRVRHLL